MTTLPWHPGVLAPVRALPRMLSAALRTSRVNFGQGFERICKALAQLGERYPHVQFVYPVHLNPQVQQAVYGVLSGRGNIHLVPPQDYPHFDWLMNRADVILTDSGGVQEEAPALGKPVLVLRKVTERPAVLKGGTVKLVGTDTDQIVAQTSLLLDDPEAYARMARVYTPFGDGHASERIAERLSRWLEEQAAGRGDA